MIERSKSYRTIYTIISYSIFVCDDSSHHEHWTLKNWKNVIWTDEMSIVLNAQRERNRVVWRTSHEAIVKINIRKRYARHSEFMFSDFFSYDKKKSFHIWMLEIAKKKKKTQTDLNMRNERHKKKIKQEWELKIDINRLELRNREKRKSAWKWDKNHEKLVRQRKEEVDWYRYQKHILLLKLLFFATMCKMKRSNIIVQKNKILSHVFKLLK